MNRLSILFTINLLLFFNAARSQTQLWVGEPYSCDLTDYANTSYDIVEKEWSKSSGLSYDYSGDYVRTVSFSEYVDGTQTVTAKWAETKLLDDSYPYFNHKSHTWSFTCKDNPLVLDDSSISVGGNDKVQIRYHFTYSNNYTSKAKLTYSSSNTSVATVASDGTVTPKGKGTATITVKSSISKDSKTCSVTVTSEPVVTKVTSISLNYSSLLLTEGAGRYLTATVYPSDATDKSVYWSSSNSSVVSVNSSGYVTAKSVGNATITCRANDGSGKYATCSVTVEAAPIKVTSISLNYSSFSIDNGDYKYLVATVYPSNATNKNVSWSSSKSGVATVSSSGRVEAKSVGSAIITCTADDGSGVYATCSVTVNKVYPMSIYFADTSNNVTLPVGGSQVLSYTVYPSYASYTVSWSSDDKTVATVNSSGKVVAQSPGTAHITVKTDNGKTATNTVTVAPQPTAVTIILGEAEMPMGRQQQLSCSFTPKDALANTITWISSDDNIVCVNQAGLLEARSPGTATITAVTDNGKTGSCTVTVPAPLYQLFVWKKDGEKTGYLSTDRPQLRLENGVVKFTTDKLSFDIHKDSLDKFTLEQVLPEHPLDIATNSSLRLGLGRSTQLTYTLSPADAQTEVTWLNSRPDIVSVTADGVVKALKVGTATLRAQTSNGLRAACLVSVPRPRYRFCVWLSDSTVESYAIAEQPQVTLGAEIFTLTTSTKTIGYAAKDLLKFTLEDTAPNAVDGDVNRDGQFTLADIIAILSVYQGTQDAVDYDADQDGDGKMTVADITKLINLYLNK